MGVFARVNRIVFFLYAFIFPLLKPVVLLGQEENKLIRYGNKLYNEKKYTEAITAYDKASKIKPENKESQFNKADALYKSEKFDEAANLFQGLAPQFENDNQKAAAYHNLGNTFIKQKKYEDAVEAYKKALKFNPKDEDTRYNLAYAQKMIQKQQNQNNKNHNQNKEQKDKKDNKEQNQENKDKKDENKDKNKKDDKGEENKKEEERDNKDQSKPKPDNNEMKKEDAQRILEALNREEKELQDKKRREMKKAVRVQVEKDW